MAKKIEILLVIVTLLLISEVNSEQFEDNSVSSCFKRIKEIFPDNWEVIQIDEKPSVSVQGWDGYRFVLGVARKEYINVGQQERTVADPNAYNDYDYVMKYSHIDLVLFPTDARLDTIQNIPWLELKQECFVKPVYMGTGDGFHWFVNASIYWQEYIRKKMGLAGGDNRIRLLIEGLSIDDARGNTRNSVVHLLAEHGDVVIPYLQETIKEEDYEGQQTAFHVFGYIRTDKATELLREYYASKKTRELAAYALSHQPYLPEAGDDYIDMLKRRIRLNNAIDACEKLNIKEALPHIEDICEKPGIWHIYYQAYLAKRMLQDNPVSEEMTEAYTVIKGSSEPNEIKQAKSTILTNADKEAATVMALNLIFLRGKIPTDRLEYFQKTGFDLLSALPKETTKPLIRHLLDTLDEEPSGTPKWLSPKDKLWRFYKKTDY